MGVRLTGAILVILSGTWCGLNAARQLSQDCGRVGDLQRALERMYTAVCLCRASLPEALDTLKQDYPALFAAQGSDSGAENEHCFRETWRQSIRAAELPPIAKAAAIRLGGALAAGDDPERAFSATRRELDQLRETLRTRQKERSRVYAALGVSGGFLAALLLL